MKTRLPRALIATVGFLLVSVQALAQVRERCGEPEAAPIALIDLDLESLLNVKVITASKFDQSMSRAPGIVSVVSHDELENFGGTTLQEILERVPGLSGTTAYFTDRSLIAARGDQTKINGGHLLILINGRPSREILEGGLVSDLLQAFPIRALDRIEVVKGPGSVLYGSNAFSAVVNLITLKPDRNGWSLDGLADGTPRAPRPARVHARTADVGRGVVTRRSLE